MSAGSGRRGAEPAHARRGRRRPPSSRRAARGRPGLAPAPAGRDQDRACRAPGLPGSARRRTPSICRSPARVSRLVASMAARASRASAGWVSMTRRPTPAWIAMMPMLCATISCSSRAIRSRSVTAACAWACVRRASACSAACRTEWPRQPGDDRGQQDNHVELDRHLQALGHEHGGHAEDHQGGDQRGPARPSGRDEADLDAGRGVEQDEQPQAQPHGVHRRRRGRDRHQHGQREQRPAAQQAADTTTTQATTADAHMMTIVTTPARPGLLARWRTPAG